MTPIKMVGKTEAGAPVMAGAGQMMTTHGVPLEITLAGFKQRGWVCDWVDYVTTCVRDGHNMETIRARALAATADVYGPAHAEAVGERLAILIERGKSVGGTDEV